MLQLAAGDALGVDVGDLFELQSSLEGDREAETASGVKEAAVPAVLVRQRRDFLLTLEDASDLVRQLAKRGHQLLLALQRDTTVSRRQPHGQQVKAHDMREIGLRRGNTDLGTGVQVDRAVRVAGGRAGKHVGHGHGQGFAVLSQPHAGQRVRGLARLRDDHGKRVAAEGRPPVAELRGVHRTRMYARPVLDRELTQHRRVPRGSHAEQQHFSQPREVLVGGRELAEGNHTVICQAAAHGIRHCFGRLVDLLEHEVRVAALLGLAHVPVDVHQLRLDGRAVERGDLSPERRHRGHLAFTEHEDALGVRDDRSDVRSDVVLVIAETHHQGRVQARPDQKIGILSREHGHCVRTVEALESSSHCRKEVALVVSLDQVWHDLGVGLRRELMTLRLQLSAQLGEVLDDAVVHDVDLALAVGVRVRVDVRRLAMGRPAGVPDAEVARRHSCLELGDEVVDLGFRLGDAGPD